MAFILKLNKERKKKWKTRERGDKEQNNKEKLCWFFMYINFKTLFDTLNDSLYFFMLCTLFLSL